VAKRNKREEKMNTKRDFLRAKFLVFLDIIFTGLTILTGWVWECTPEDALNPKYQDQVSDSFSFVLFMLFILSLMLVIVAWTMILCRKGKGAIAFYGFSILFGYFSTFFFIWAVNGYEHIFGTLKLLVSGALIWHLNITDIEGKDEEKSEGKPKENDIPDRKSEETESEMRKQRKLSRFQRRKNSEAK
jgi:hypothetical protein